jgi:hypothetical protein
MKDYKMDAIIRVFFWNVADHELSPLISYMKTYKANKNLELDHFSV